jgi:2-(1,2-epoxy-1,2-dihydrophenyl)acetyl-CoA isomerase
MSDDVLLEIRDHVAHLTLNRPTAGNAIDLATAKALLAAAVRCDEDGDVRAVLLTGAGTMFCAGGDLRSFAASSGRLGELLTELTQALHAAIARLAHMDAPVVAAVNGAAAGAGMSLACAADLVVAAESARFTMAYTAAGLSPDGSSTYFLPRLIGLRRTVELMLTNRRLSAAEALEWGIVNQVVPDAELGATAARLAGTLAGGPTRAFGTVKKLLLASALQDLQAQLDVETRGIVGMAATDDAREGIAAFLAKRRPVFHGR